MNDTASAPKQARARPGQLLNRAAVRRFILDAVSGTRPYLRISRVSQEALDQIEAWLRQKLRSEVARHPSKGRTFKL